MAVVVDVYRLPMEGEGYVQNVVTRVFLCTLDYRDCNLTCVPSVLELKKHQGVLAVEKNSYNNGYSLSISFVFVNGS